MAVKYLLPCGCGESLQVDVSQAGSTIPCACGRELEVPTLRGLRELAEVEVASISGKSRWTPAQGVLFTLGLVLLVVGIGAVAYGYPRVRAVQPIVEVDEHKLFSDSLEDLTPSQLYDMWKELHAHGLVERGKNAYVMNRKFSSQMKTITAVGLGLAVVGGIAIGASMIGTRK